MTQCTTRLLCPAATHNPVNTCKTHVAPKHTPTQHNTYPSNRIVLWSALPHTHAPSQPYRYTILHANRPNALAPSGGQIQTPQKPLRQSYHAILSTTQYTPHSTTSPCHATKRLPRHDTKPPHSCTNPQSCNTHTPDNNQLTQPAIRNYTTPNIH